MNPTHLHGLARKEILQVVRDPSALLIAFLLPIILLLVNGYGISLDARNLSLAVVMEQPDELSREAVQALANSPYLRVVTVPNAEAATQRMISGEARGALILRADFSERLARSARWPARAQLLVNATDPNTGRILEGYVAGALEAWMTGLAHERRLRPSGGVALDNRYWFNPALRSGDFIIPGMVAFVMSMTGTLLTALIVAREWERGTMEAMLASPARMGELIVAKLGVYFVLGMLAMTGAVVMAVLLFGVPFRGSLLALGAAAALFLLFALSLGLFISTLARNQFVAAQVAFLTTMLPALMLSGMVFDIASMPSWLQMLTYAVPARYLVSILQTLFLVGTVWPVLLPNLAALAIAAALAIGATVAVTRRRLD
ncbi:MAG: ABC transporter permease [Acetobacteraceae bacterium]